MENFPDLEFHELSRRQNAVKGIPQCVSLDNKSEFCFSVPYCLKYLQGGNECFIWAKKAEH